MANDIQTAVFGSGCFWCSEAVFVLLRGVKSVMPGYAGGHTAHPAYEDVCTGATGHAEVVRVEFDPSVISYNDLLTVFFASHDPTSVNQQGNDIGTQYRSVIFWADEDQREQAERFIKTLDEQGDRSRPIVTELQPLAAFPFYEAEPEHHRYFQSHPERAYCQLVINPKLSALKEKFSQLMNV